MSDDRPEVHVCDDWISIPLPDWHKIPAAQHILAASDHWTETVPGLDSIAIQFDPARLAPDQAAHIALDQLSELKRAPDTASSTTVIPVCYDAAFGPDRDYVAEKLGIPAAALPSWHSAQMQRVAMLGFMPGFAYLESMENCGNIGRLANPRQSVAAGSIGIIGRQSCIYSFDSPGGWPIIGRTPLSLFDPARDQPALLSAGDKLRFEAISKTTFDNWPREPAA
ncbi:5-oxoprolinase subunit B family protein [Sphingorhabdus sp. SMR4y]|uniref:5-oxoprolinase subunit B family protein n=1 Tax=Sphingorhabdus sp. SMR4y TaxID=2584094 RepID=UPI000B5C4988|nr:carboxyltransferase domain-containing protein [Sphingorhabdus sp. SMR4y]ASK88051.1 kinase A inhibitor [Sphingorhabdus sp. SMR4y]